MKPSVVVVQGVVRNGGSYLVMKRSDQAEHSPGKWEFPSGKPLYKESMEDAIMREVREETGLNVELGNRIVSETEGTVAQLIVVTYICESRSRNVTPSFEHTEFKWMSVDDIGKMILAPATKFILTKLGDSNAA
jgi:mutator protein MutT